jgi:hypothetical protein
MPGWIGGSGLCAARADVRGAVVSGRDKAGVRESVHRISFVAALSRRRKTETMSINWQTRMHSSNHVKGFSRARTAAKARAMTAGAAREVKRVMCMLINLLSLLELRIGYSPRGARALRRALRPAAGNIFFGAAAESGGAEPVERKRHGRRRGTPDARAIRERSPRGARVLRRIRLFARITPFCRVPQRGSRELNFTVPQGS